LEGSIYLRNGNGYGDGKSSTVSAKVLNNLLCYLNPLPRED